jgi:hypothetical protein
MAIHERPPVVHRHHEGTFFPPLLRILIHSNSTRLRRRPNRSPGDCDGGNWRRGFVGIGRVGLQSAKFAIRSFAVRLVDPTLDLFVVAVRLIAIGRLLLLLFLASNGFFADYGFFACSKLLGWLQLLRKLCAPERRTRRGKLRGFWGGGRGG